MLTTDIRPDLDDVGSLMRARTRDDVGRELGTFTTATRPTAAEVSELIDAAAADVRAEVPPDVPDVLEARIRSLMTLAAAQRIEVSYFPDQVAAGRSPFEQYRELYRDGVRTLGEAMRGNQPAGPTRIHSVPIRTPYADDDTSALIN